jgi:hypothetical protein
MGRERQLYEDPGDGRIVRQREDELLEFVRARGRGQVAVQVTHPQLHAHPPLVANVDRGGGVLADQDRGQAGRLHHPLDLVADVVAHERGDGPAVNHVRPLVHGTIVTERSFVRRPSVFRALVPARVKAAAVALGRPAAEIDRPTEPAELLLTLALRDALLRFAV